VRASKGFKSILAFTWEGLKKKIDEGLPGNHGQQVAAWTPPICLLEAPRLDITEPEIFLLAVFFLILGALCWYVITKDTP
jgi:hypothetical protein